MKKIGFVGAYDKTDMMIYVGKILTTLKQKVLIVDSTLTQKAKYIVPVINPTTTYVTEYEEMDVAVGFPNLDDIKQYLGVPIDKQLEYDYVLIDVDNIRSFNSYELQTADKNYFVTSFDMYSLKKGLETLIELKESISMTKIVFSNELLREDDEYLNFLSASYKVVWNEYKLWFPVNTTDLAAIAENQRLSKVKFRKMSAAYKDGLAFLVVDLAKEMSESSIRKAIKIIEKGA